VKTQELTESQYHIFEPIGQGQFAQVFRGVHRETDEVVALKQINFNRSNARCFLHELDLIARLRHPNIVRFHGLDYSGQGRYLVTDYYEGGTLRDLIEAPEPVKLTECLKLTIDVLQGLEYIHQAGVVHCDLKPENILLTQTELGWKAAIGDFGVARLTGSIDDRQQNQKVIGSPAYTAPECHYQGHSYASDIYAIGILLFEWVVGQRPFAGQPGALMNAHFNQSVVLPATVPYALRSVLTTALQKLPQRRFPSVAVMLKSVRLAAEIIQQTQPEAVVGMGDEPKMSDAIG
jgi:eukaryotic-like serine/threonine-protein kinase